LRKAKEIESRELGYHNDVEKGGGILGGRRKEKKRREGRKKKSGHGALVDTQRGKELQGAQSPVDPTLS